MAPPRGDLSPPPRAESIPEIRKVAAPAEEMERSAAFRERRRKSDLNAIESTGRGLSPVSTPRRNTVCRVALPGMEDPALIKELAKRRASKLG